MFDYMQTMVDHGHEQLVFNYDKETGLRAIIAIHSTQLGPSLGGCRLWTYDSIDSAARDALRLSEGMTYKAAVAGLPLGGGKSVILADGNERDPLIRAARFRAFGRFIESLGGRYITAEDVGTSPDDMVNILESTQYAAGRPEHLGGSGDPSPMTAFGVLRGIQAAGNFVFKSNSLDGMRVAIQGLGKVGYALAEYLVEAGCTVYATDIRPDTVTEAQRKLGVKPVELDAIYDVDCDIFAPCALGAILNDQTIPRLKCKVIAGSANNQLEDPDTHSQALADAGITYLVDYVINSGGLINVTGEIEGYGEDEARARTSRVYDTIMEMLTIADDHDMTPYEAAQAMARNRLSAKEAAV